MTVEVVYMKILMRSMAGVARIELANTGVMVVEVGFEPTPLQRIRSTCYELHHSTKSGALTAWLHAIINSATNLLM